MIDHVLGRPSTQFRKIQVFSVVFFWILYLIRGNRHGPPGARLISSRLFKRMTPWQTTVMTMLTLYLSRNFAKLVGLECPEPLANLYSRSYFRATWITTALDAGFWTAMNIKRKWLRDLASFIFSIYYLIAAEQADEKVRKVRAVLTVDHMRVSWNKATTPYLSFIAGLLRPRFCKYDPIAVRIPRPKESSYKEPSSAWLYFNGPLSALRNQDTIVLDIPGGGFVAMNPRTSDDKLLTWAGKTGIPILSLDYKKAPEHPYPYALNECYDVYHTIVMTKGRCIGLSGKTCPRIILTGDSAGGNLATGLTLMLLQSGSTDSRKWRGEDFLPVPAGLILIYPSLDMNIGSWMTDEQMSLIRDRGMRKTNQNVLRRKSEDYYKLAPSTPHPSTEGLEDHSVLRDYFAKQHGSLAGDVESASLSAAERSDPTIDKPVPGNVASQVVAMADKQPQQIRTRLAVSSMISYFNDRVLTPEMMRAMIILYIGPYNRPDFSTDFLLSPLLAPEALLARFPKTYFLTGERDPLVDDTVIFAGRIRQAKLHRFRERQELGLEKSKMEFDEKAHVEVTLIPGISHGFLNFVSVFPEGWKQVFRCTKWILDIRANAARENAERESNASTSSLAGRRRAASEAVRRQPGIVSTNQNVPEGKDAGETRHHHRRLTGESSADEDGPLEMSIRMTKIHSSSSSSSCSSSSSKRRDSTSPPTEVLDDTEATNSADASGTRAKSSRKTKSSKLKHPVLSLKQEKRAMRINRQDSLTSLPSEEDLLHRRMKGLAGGLMGIGEEARTP
ncbi:alpha/beta hydrolase fold domain containing protein [Coccidioides posadasii C735 delta SOWgp]|uniref:Alpha/beta hydrolase fold domain containing protein n=1 Tax=Coccidioides posadasii (strain C735) TaxID=222929 RepID=C5PBP8_COCP7|nr:alpha/beta hydrolase fold domain containing protein [Coccidioides posadasii C735 delta SOWgp]EER25375.1 alpha/beta hydrolase fold domain containing protein [Coccidioides posadasii C735 delta SOWgp]|eukprot:XP_003067520.1 alpha/beta hydrolase fold domain containing protein [Coccidioides posadasii C735 delta SOWgp]